MSIDLSPFNPDLKPMSIRMSAFANYLEMGVHYGWKPLGLIFSSQRTDVYKIDEHGNAFLTSSSGMFEDLRLSDKSLGTYCASDGHLFDPEDIGGLLQALSNHKEKDADLVEFMSFLSQSDGIIIL